MARFVSANGNVNIVEKDYTEVYFDKVYETSVLEELNIDSKNKIIIPFFPTDKGDICSLDIIASDNEGYDYKYQKDTLIPSVPQYSIINATSFIRTNLPLLRYNLKNSPFGTWVILPDCDDFTTYSGNERMCITNQTYGEFNPGDPHATRDIFPGRSIVEAARGIVKGDDDDPTPLNGLWDTDAYKYDYYNSFVERILTLDSQRIDNIVGLPSAYCMTTSFHVEAVTGTPELGLFLNATGTSPDDEVIKDNEMIKIVFKEGSVKVYIRYPNEVDFEEIHFEDNVPGIIADTIYYLEAAIRNGVLYFRIATSTPAEGHIDINNLTILNEYKWYACNIPPNFSNNTSSGRYMCWGLLSKDLYGKLFVQPASGDDDLLYNHCQDLDARILDVQYSLTHLPGEDATYGLKNFAGWIGVYNANNYPTVFQPISFKLFYDDSDPNIVLSVKDACTNDVNVCSSGFLDCSVQITDGGSYSLKDKYSYMLNDFAESDIDGLHNPLIPYRDVVILKPSSTVGAKTIKTKVYNILGNYSTQASYPITYTPAEGYMVYVEDDSGDYIDVSSYVDGNIVIKNKRNACSATFSIKDIGGIFSHPSNPDYISVDYRRRVLISVDGYPLFSGGIKNKPMSSKGTNVLAITASSDAHLKNINTSGLFLVDVGDDGYKYVEDVVYDMIYEYSYADTFAFLSYTKPKDDVDKTPLTKSYAFDYKNILSCIEKITKDHGILYFISNVGSEYVLRLRDITYEEDNVPIFILDDSNCISISTVENTKDMYNVIYLIDKDNGIFICRENQESIAKYGRIEKELETETFEDVTTAIQYAESLLQENSKPIVKYTCMVNVGQIDLFTLLDACKVGTLFELNSSSLNESVNSILFNSKITYDGYYKVELTLGGEKFPNIEPVEEAEETLEFAPKLSFSGTSYADVSVELVKQTVGVGNPWIKVGDITLSKSGKDSFLNIVAGINPLGDTDDIINNTLSLSYINYIYETGSRPFYPNLNSYSFPSRIDWTSDSTSIYAIIGSVLGNNVYDSEMTNAQDQSISMVWRYMDDEKVVHEVNLGSFETPNSMLSTSQRLGIKITLTRDTTTNEYSDVSVNFLGDCIENYLYNCAGADTANYEEHAFNSIAMGHFKLDQGDINDLRKLVNQGEITGFTAASSFVLITCSEPHNLMDGDLITIFNTTNYDGIHVVSYYSATEFLIVHTYYAEGSGNFESTTEFSRIPAMCFSLPKSNSIQIIGECSSSSLSNGIKFTNDSRYVSTIWEFGFANDMEMETLKNNYYGSNLYGYLDGVFSKLDTVAPFGFGNSQYDYETKQDILEKKIADVAGTIPISTKSKELEQNAVDVTEVYIKSGNVRNGLYSHIHNTNHSLENINNIYKNPFVLTNGVDTFKPDISNPGICKTIKDYILMSVPLFGTYYMYKKRKELINTAVGWYKYAKARKNNKNKKKKYTYDFFFFPISKEEMKYIRDINLLFGFKYKNSDSISNVPSVYIWTKGLNEEYINSEYDLQNSSDVNDVDTINSESKYFFNHWNKMSADESQCGVYNSHDIKKVAYKIAVPIEPLKLDRFIVDIGNGTYGIVLAIETYKKSSSYKVSGSILSVEADVLFSGEDGKMTDYPLIRGIDYNYNYGERRIELPTIGDLGAMIDGNRVFQESGVGGNILSYPTKGEYKTSLGSTEFSNPDGTGTLVLNDVPFEFGWEMIKKYLGGEFLSGSYKVIEESGVSMHLAEQYAFLNITHKEDIHSYESYNSFNPIKLGGTAYNNLEYLYSEKTSKNVRTVVDNDARDKIIPFITRYVNRVHSGSSKYFNLKYQPHIWFGEGYWDGATYITDIVLDSPTETVKCLLSSPVRAIDKEKKDIESVFGYTDIPQQRDDTFVNPITFCNPSSGYDTGGFSPISTPLNTFIRNANPLFFFNARHDGDRAYSVRGVSNHDIEESTNPLVYPNSVSGGWQDGYLHVGTPTLDNVCYCYVGSMMTFVFDKHCLENYDFGVNGDLKYKFELVSNVPTGSFPGTQEVVMKDVTITISKSGSIYNYSVEDVWGISGGSVANLDALHKRVVMDVYPALDPDFVNIVDGDWFVRDNIVRVGVYYNDILEYTKDLPLVASSISFSKIPEGWSSNLYFNFKNPGLYWVEYQKSNDSSYIGSRHRLVEQTDNLPIVVPNGSRVVASSAVKFNFI